MSAKKQKIVTVDVRQEIANGGEPFPLIMRAVTGLRSGEKMLLIAPFEPVPLYDVMAMQGFAHQSKPIANGDWEVLFSRYDDAA